MRQSDDKPATCYSPHTLIQLPTKHVSYALLQNSLFQGQIAVANRRRQMPLMLLAGHTQRSAKNSSACMQGSQVLTGVTGLGLRV